MYVVFAPDGVIDKSRAVFYTKKGRWIMSRNVIFVLMYHRHKLLGLIMDSV
jgi:hypothetical protein